MERVDALFDHADRVCGDGVENCQAADDDQADSRCQHRDIQAAIDDDIVYIVVDHIPQTVEAVDNCQHQQPNIIDTPDEHPGDDLIPADGNKFGCGAADVGNRRAHR